MEHPINRCIEANENDPCLSLTALIVVLALIFTPYFAVRVAVPELPLHALAGMPSVSEQAANASSMIW